MFWVFYIAKATVLHSFFATEHVVDVRMIFIFVATEVDVVCRYRPVFFVHVTLLRVGDVLVY